MKKWGNRFAKSLIAIVLILSMVAATGIYSHAEEMPNPEGETTEEKPIEDMPDESDTVVEEMKKRDWNEDNVLKILSIGNSFSVDCQEYLYDIIRDLGVNTIKLGNLHISKASLEMHLKNAQNGSDSYNYSLNQDGTWVTYYNCSINQVVAGDDWDYIVFQQSSASSGIYEDYSVLPELIDIVEEIEPQARLVWNMTWAYDTDSEHSGFPAYCNSQDLMYYSIVAAVQKIMEDNSKLEMVIPVGTAIQNARTSYLGDTLTRDGYHLSYTLGRYIAGITFASALTGMEITNLTYRPEKVSTQARDLAIESVKNAVAIPNKVTKSQYNTSYRDQYYLTHPEEICIVTGEPHVTKTTTKKASMKYSGYKIKRCKTCNVITSVKEIGKVTTVKLAYTSYTYNGKARKPAVIVKNSDGKSLKNGTDYSVSYSKGRKTPGTYIVTVTLKGNYTGSKECSFTIKPKGTRIAKLTAGKKRLTVKWEKITSQISGYEIQYAARKTFQNKKTIRVSAKKTSAVIEKLSGKKKYYIRIRSYKEVNGKKYNSSWSKVQSVTTKK